MRWTPGGRSRNVEDRRGESGGGFTGGGLRVGARGLGLGGILLLLVLSFVFKQNFFALLDSGGLPAGGAESSAAVADPREEELVQFVSFVLDDVQGVWAKEFPQMGRPYQDAILVLFRDVTHSPCGMAQSATGPFYCPADQKVYIDLGFYEELKRRFGAPGDFAQAYVLAHEIGHHVQTLLGIEQKVRAAQQRNRRQANALSVRMELQADCLAGVWAHSTQRRNLLEQGDIEEGMAAAAAVGDDRIQQMSGGRVAPESFTHGSSQQRVEWFTRGFRSGEAAACNTFGG